MTSARIFPMDSLVANRTPFVRLTKLNPENESSQSAVSSRASSVVPTGSKRGREASDKDEPEPRPGASGKASKKSRSDQPSGLSRSSGRLRDVPPPEVINVDPDKGKGSKQLTPDQTIDLTGSSGRLRGASGEEPKQGSGSKTSKKSASDRSSDQTRSSGRLQDESDEEPRPYPSRGSKKSASDKPSDQSRSSSRLRNESEEEPRAYLSRGSKKPTSDQTRGSGRLRDVSEEEEGSAASPSRASQKSRSPQHQPSSWTHVPGRSITDMTSVLGAVASSKSKAKPEKAESLTKSVGGMMSYLFGDNLADECPDGFVVNVRLEVEKKNDGEPNSDKNSQGTCCKAKKPELCPCLKKVSDSKLAAVLKERIEQRRDLSVSSKGTLLASILSFMQELESAG